MTAQHPEITWSLMHPTPLDPEYMKQVVAAADASPLPVDSFEICAQCHNLIGGLDGLGHYDKYPQLVRDRAAVDANIACLRNILAIAHASGRPVYYWHREVTVPDGLTALIPELLDERGEFNLLGPAYEALIRYKFQQAFDNVPELDGIVLTLTEADYSAIHNSTPETYPPAEVVRKVAGIFADELQKRGKRFILRSFGSIAQDYEDILAGAELLNRDGLQFEVETKLTPYDFDPFLPANPFLRHTGTLTLGAECDGLGEFLGAGFLPSENTERIAQWVRTAQSANVERFTIRIDRVGNRALDNCPVNLFAYLRAIGDTPLTAADIEREFFAPRLPAECLEQRLQLSHLGMAAILKTHFVQGNVIFHQNPPKASLKYLKAGGFFALFTEHVPLAALRDIWSILADHTTTTRADILAEKDDAVAMARQGLAILDTLAPHLPAERLAILRRLWHNLLCAADCIREFCRATAAYFDDMEAARYDHPALDAAIATAEDTFRRYDDSGAAMTANPFFNGLERDAFSIRSAIAEVYPRPIRGLLELLRQDFEAEAAARRQAPPAAVDFYVGGSLTDEWRTARAMHASHATLTEDGRLCRLIGNQVFPNGQIDVTLTAPHPVAALHLDGTGRAILTVNDTTRELTLTPDTAIPLTLPATSVRFSLKGADGQFPTLFTAWL